MGPYTRQAQTIMGVWMRINLSGDFPDGKWVQTFSDSTGISGWDCNPLDCPFYPSYASGKSYFFDGPSRFSSHNVTWVGQASYVRPNQPGAAFTIEWGFSIANGKVTYNRPRPATPWPSHEKLIGAAKQWIP
jgi:hypothetical protein